MALAIHIRKLNEPDNNVYNIPTSYERLAAIGVII